MKPNTILGITLMIAIVIAIILVGYQMISPVALMPNVSEQVKGGSSNVAGQLSSSIILDAPYPNPVEKILIFKVVPPKLSREDIISIGQKFGITTTNTIKDGPQGFGIASDDLKIQAYHFNSGSIEFHNTNRHANVNPLDVPGKLPSDFEAIEIATNFLKKQNLLPDGAFFKRVEHGKITQLVKNGDDIVTWEDVQVWYGRKLNGLEVKGTKISIDIGGNGDIIDFYSNWREYTPYMEIPVIPPEQAFMELKSKGIPVDTKYRESVTINEISLAYRSKPGSQEETYLEPVWVFSGNVMENGKSVRPVEEYIPALREVPPEFGGPKPITSIPTTSFTVNLTTIPTMTAIVSVNETATPTISASPTTNSTSLAEQTNQTATLTLPSTTIAMNTTSGFNATNGS